MARGKAVFATAVHVGGGLAGGYVERASIVECGSPLPLSLGWYLTQGKRWKEWRDGRWWALVDFEHAHLHSFFTTLALLQSAIIF